MKVQILASARDDLIDGFYFYERKETGLGAYFLSSLYSDIESLRLYGGSHLKSHKNHHRSLSKRFPFAIFYTLDGDIVLVRSVVDCRRKPSWIRRHLKQSESSGATEPPKAED